MTNSFACAAKDIFSPVNFHIILFGRSVTGNHTPLIKQTKVGFLTNIYIYISQERNGIPCIRNVNTELGLFLGIIDYTESY